MIPHHFYHDMGHTGYQGMTGTGLIQFALTTLISIGVFIVAYYTYKNSQDKLFTPANINRSGFQALFLTNNQVYFGKITQVDKALVKLEQIYYLQESIVPDQANEKNLVKLGQELHGPEDIMFIDRSHVIFWENLKSDSAVAKAIKEHKRS